MNRARVLYGVAAMFGTLGLLFLILPARAPRARASEPSGAAPALSTPASSNTRKLAEYATIVTSNLFSADRTPPRVRFVPAGLAARDNSGPRGTRPLLRLYGITVGAQGATALIDADPSIPGAEIYHVGDLVAGAPIVAINDSSVVLAQPSGQRVLQLQSSSRKRP